MTELSRGLVERVQVEVVLAARGGVLALAVDAARVVVAATRPLQVRAELARRGQHEADIGRRGLQRTRQVLRVVLHAHVVRVRAQLHHFHAVAVLGLAREEHAGRLQRAHHVRADLVAVAVSLVHRVNVAVESLYSKRKKMSA